MKNSTSPNQPCPEKGKGKASKEVSFKEPVDNGDSQLDSDANDSKSDQSTPTSGSGGDSNEESDAEFRLVSTIMNRPKDRKRGFQAAI
ncbi:hypothetical protein CBER1_11763 [Cercospora berteroae]|uniref:Uncharacterized protein n=1 Tax=Cercospora berteroae TaxID=357750 RepID=A0A2S6CIK4_9PEZI|nr:hypothetical protein CBER1_11763 [Cercospora berteroae]